MKGEVWAQHMRPILMRHPKFRFHCKFQVSSHLAKKNSRNIFRTKSGRMFPGKSKQLIDMENYHETQFKSAAIYCKVFEPLKGHFWMCAWFHFDNFYKKDGTERKLPDASNLYQLPEDCLQSAGVIANDSRIFSHDLSRRLPSHETALEIFLFEFKEIEYGNYLVEAVIQ